MVRSFLVVTGYPKVGGGGLPIAHVLWGGLLMGIAIVIVQVHPGSRARRRSAVLGGIGFGLFFSRPGDRNCAVSGTCQDSLIDSDTASPVHFVGDFTVAVQGWP